LAALLICSKVAIGKLSSDLVRLEWYKVKKNQVSHWEIFYMNGPMAVVEGCLKYGGTQ